MKTEQRPDLAAGFTLIEMVIATALMALILVSAYLCLNACFASRKLMEPRLEAFQNARVALALITADLRGACPLDTQFEFLGMHRTLGERPADNLDFATHNYTPKHAREGDFCETSYFVDRDPEDGQLALWRRQNPTIAPDPLSGGRKQEIARNVRGLQFEYYDGFDWYDTWGDVDNGKSLTSNKDQSNLSGLPVAVRITLWLGLDAGTNSSNSVSEKKSEPPLEFQTVAKLELASVDSDSSDNTSSGSSPTQDSGNASGQVNNPPGGPQ